MIANSPAGKCTHPDFERFCEIVIKAVVNSWKTESTARSVDKRILWPTEFTDCKTDFERVCVLLQFPEVRNFQFCEDRKIRAISRNKISFESQSNCFRQLGNSAWRANDWKQALLFYDNALKFAVNDAQKSLVYANRSVVWKSLKFCSRSLADINRAIQCNYPKRNRYRLIIRRAECLIELGQVEEAKTDLIELQSQLENTPNKRAINDLIERNLSLCANILNGLGSPSNNDCDPSNDIDFFGELPLSNTSHKSKGRKKGRSRHPMCSVPFDVIYNGDALGWGLIASRDIQPAEMVIMEKPYVAVTGMPGIGLLCEECLRWCVNPIPCRSCSEVVFCSEECEQASWATSWVKPEESSPRPTVSRNRMPHSLICGQLERLSLEDYANWKTLRQCNERGQKSDVLIYCQRLIMRFDLPSIGGSSDAILAYACVASTPPWIIGELVQHPTNSGKVDSPLSAFSGSRVLPTSGIGTGDYRSIGWLETNSAKRTPWDLWQRTVAAVFLTHCLSDGGYPLIWSQPDCIRDPGNCQEIARGSQLPASWAAACILYHLQSVQLNGFVMKGRIVTIHDALPRIGFTPNEHQMMVRERPGYLGSALYPTLSLVNHSCDPNCALIFMRDGYCGLFATEHIAKGSALLISYGVHYTTHSLFQRRQELKHFYQFECSCQACRDNQYGAESQWDMICSRCSRPFSPHEMRSKRIVQPNRCLCSSEIKRRDFDRVSRILQELPRNNVEAMILKYLGAWGQGGLSSSLESHIANAARQLNQNNLGGCIARYGLPLVDLKKHLMKLLQYRFGFRFLELQIDPLIELLNCLTLDSGL